MNLRLLFKAILIKGKKSNKSKKLIAASYVSLFLAVFLIVVSAVSWFTASSSVTIESETLSMRGASGMRNDKNNRNLNEIVIPSFTLEEASSVDGRNIFFPTSMFNNISEDDGSGTQTKNIPTGSGNNVKQVTVTKDPKTQTANMVFRDATAGDKCQRYAYAEAALNSAKDNTNVWIRGYKVEIADDVNGTNKIVYEDKLEIGKNLDSQTVPQDCPVRIAIISDSGDDFKVIDPSAIVKDYAINTDAVYSISAEGVPTQHRTLLDAFSSFYYGTKNPLFTLDAGESKDIAVIAWLEGSHSNARNFEGKKLSIEITIETNVSDMGMVYFHDYTSGDSTNLLNGTAENTTKDNYRNVADNGVSDITGAHTGHWLANDNAIIVMTYLDTSSGEYKSAPMTHLPNGHLSDDGVVTAIDDYTYCAAIKSDVVTDISFYRLAPFVDYQNNSTNILKGNVYNAWHTRSGINSKLSNDAKSWRDTFGLGNLLESRTKETNGDTETYWHYFAIRGNGHGVVDSTASDRYTKWLSPCVGYWGDNSGTVVGASGKQVYE